MTVSQVIGKSSVSRSTIRWARVTRDWRERSISSNSPGAAGSCR